jgi:Holliday junction DNA helicase RuvA
MFSYLKGELTEIHTDHIVVETGGIGYMLVISGQAMTELPPVGSDIKVYTYLYLREDILMLYGFLDRDELDVFKLLIGVSGIGPKGAIGVLSALSPDDLRFAVLAGDSKAISKAPGIGAKTAQRVVLELKDKLSLEDAIEKKQENSARVLADSSGSSVKNDAVLALTALGYSSSESLKAVSKVEITDAMDVEDVLKAALKRM